MEDSICSRSPDDEPFSFEAFSARWRAGRERMFGRTYDQQQGLIIETDRRLGILATQPTPESDSDQVMDIALPPDDLDQPPLET